MLAVESPIGIEQVLQGRAALGEVCVSLADPMIDVYPCVRPHRQAHTLLTLPSFEVLIRDLEERYAAVIIDTGPSLLVPDAKLVMRCAGSCVAVARVGMTRVHRFMSMLDLLPKDKFLGKVLNQVTLPDHADEEHEDVNEETE